MKNSLLVAFVLNFFLLGNLQCSQSNFYSLKKPGEWVGTMGAIFTDIILSKKQLQIMHLKCIIAAQESILHELKERQKDYETAITLQFDINTIMKAQGFNNFEKIDEINVCNVDDLKKMLLMLKNNKKKQKQIESIANARERLLAYKGYFGWNTSIKDKTNIVNEVKKATQLYNDICADFMGDSGTKQDEDMIRECGRLSDTYIQALKAFKIEHEINT